MTTAALAAVLCIAGCDGRPGASAPPDAVGSASEPHVAELDLRNGVPEDPGGSIFGGSGPGMFELIAEMRSIREADEAKGVMVRLGAGSVGMARAEEIGRLLAALRDKKLPVVCHADGYDNATMLLAARGCDEIWLSPAGHVDTVGLAAQLIFGRPLLDALEVEVDFLQVGKFKGAKEPFTNESASPENRQSLQNALGGVRAAWLEGIAGGRDKSADALALEDGPHTAEAALKLGLIDSVGFEQDARKKAFALAGVEGKLDYFGGRGGDGGGFAELVRVLSGGQASPLPHIAVVRATGGITLSGGGGLFGGGGIEERALGDRLRKLGRDDAVRAVVMRIDSPGGSALASDLLWRAMMDLREQKPLIVSVGGMAASGGYYMACAGTKVVAERASIIGSIGVVAGKLAFHQSLEQLGIRVESVPANPNGGTRALYWSSLASWDDATRAKLQASIESTYDLFIQRIAEGRKLDPSQVHPSAEGRLMAGDEAKAAGLIDDIGGLSDAIAIARTTLGAGDELPAISVDADGGLLGMLGLDDPTSRAVAMAEIERRTAARAARALAAGLWPFSAEIEAFAVSTTPLMSGEYVVVALPFAFALR